MPRSITGVNKTRGCVVVTRPDQYVGYVGELEDGADLEAYFSNVLVPGVERTANEESSGVNGRNGHR